MFLALICLFIGLSIGFSQGELIEAGRSAFPEEDVVFANDKEHIEISIKNGELEIKKSVFQQIAYLTGKDLRYSNESIYYTSFEEIRNVSAYTDYPNERGKYKQTAVTSFNTEDVMSGGIFYNDSKREVFVFPTVKEGALTTLKYDEFILDPHMLGSFFFESYLPVLNSNFSVSFPAEVDLSFETLGEESDQVIFKKETKGGLTTYQWNATNIEAYKPEANSLSRGQYSPHVILKINSITIDGKKTNVLRDVGDLYTWYESLIERMEESENSELYAIVDELIKGKTSDREKAKAIFNWVQGNINYVAFEDGMGGFVPRTAQSVCSKKYGDCKDMSNLLVDMLRHAGLKGYHTWIGTRDRPYTYEKVPTPIVDNHMIATVEIDGEKIFLDATGKYTPFGMPTSMIQGKEGLIGIGEKKYEIKEVYTPTPEQNLLVDSIRLEVVDQTIKGTGVLSMTGYVKGNFRYSYDNNRDDETYFSSYLRKGNNKFQIEGETKVSGLESNDIPGQIDYVFEIPNYLTTFKDKVYLNMNLEKPLKQSMVDLEKRKQDRKIDYRSLRRYVVSLSIPEGYELGEVPEDVEFENDLISFKLSYSQNKSEIVFINEIKVKTLTVWKADFEDWNAAIKVLNKAYKKAIVLQLKGS